MKIKRLYTELQAKSLMSDEELERYKAFLSQEFTKDMFVNEIVEPDGTDYVDTCDNKTGFFDSKGYDEDLKEWQEAEKKVLFIDEPGMFYFLKANGIETLYELAEETKGELNINEIEI